MIKNDSDGQRLHLIRKKQKTGKGQEITDKVKTGIITDIYLISYPHYVIIRLIKKYL